MDSGMDGEDSETEYAERDPSGRYIRYNEILGRGAFKNVFKAFDEVDGIEVAWNQVRIDDVVRSPNDLERLYLEVRLLESLKHENIIKSYNSWVDDRNKTVNIITELFTSGSLRQYRKKHKNVDMKAVKSWARQILRGLQYLHGHDPPILHRDLKCDNIFVNGNHGEVKIGDLGLATIMQRPAARSVIGTPEFMAPELYDEEYNELVDIYSFGMCMLEMVTLEYPYSECTNPAQIYRKVSTGKKPAALDKVKDLQVKHFIEKCLAPASARPPAKELLNDPFLQCNNTKEPVPVPLQLPNSPSKASPPKSEHLFMDIDAKYKQLPISTVTDHNIYTPEKSCLEFQRTNGGKVFRLKGEKCEDNSISMILRMSVSSEKADRLEFSFNLDTDTSLSVATEMAEQFELSDHDVFVVAEFIDFVISKIIPGWKSSIDPCASVTKSLCKELEASDSCNPLVACSWESLQHGAPIDLAVEEALLVQLNNVNTLGSSMQHVDQSDLYSSPPHPVTREDELSLASDASGVSDEYATAIDSILNAESIAENYESFMNHSGHRTEGNEGDSSEVPVPHIFPNVMSSFCLRCPDDVSSLPSNTSLMSLVEKDLDDELKLEREMIESQYQQWCRELSRLRDEALEGAINRWLMRRKVDC
ncbi:putative serine/threonine-protein kinase WNK4 [Acorus calamus]|uniref:non-specific serine/threonine protein kinase n=1 Tax=Acorus calamus TaxID=4465 RepID=A0AAV9CC20_ACOCL|nr:putative serine/threonine-protein kinase WNK4 [Acorus calamus]